MYDIQWVAGLTLFKGWRLLKCFGVGFGLFRVSSELIVKISTMAVNLVLCSIKEKIPPVVNN